VIRYPVGIFIEACAAIFFIKKILKLKILKFFYKLNENRDHVRKTNKTRCEVQQSGPE